MGWRGETKVSIGLALTSLMLVALPAASASASARVRFVNARGGTEPIVLQVTVGGRRAPAGDPRASGEAGELVEVPSGRAEMSLTGASGARVPGKTRSMLADGASYTVIALPKGDKGFALQTLRNGKAIPGEAKLRVFHAAPELGSPDIRLGRRTIAQGLEFRAATKYLTVDPASYPLAVTKPDGGAPVFKERVSLAAGTATTVVAAGSAGSPEQLIQVNDSTVMPHGAPQTGLGAVADAGVAPWLLALLAALVAGALGGCVQLVRVRRARP
jgi:hypothetical protein